MDSFDAANEIATASFAVAAATKKKVAHSFKMDSKNVPPKAAGSAKEQAKQLALTIVQTEMAAASIVSGGKAPLDSVLKAALKILGTTPPIKGAHTSTTDYTSNLPGSPAKAFDYFVNNPKAVFGAAGLKIRPDTKKLTDGARLFLEDKGPPPVFAPIQVKLDKKKREIRITTLDGHPLRGTNVFSFTAGKNGTTKLVQKSQFQGSSPLVKVGVTLTGAIERQHEIWKKVHGHLHKKL
ncbi:MAG: hypothetical protein WBV82_01580 [Myxococcaceae bacterium]